MASNIHHRSADVRIDEDVDFSTLIRNSLLLKGLGQSGYAKPSPIQLQAIPLGRLGVDLIAQAKSGTGKTVVFSVIAIEAVNLSVKQPQVIIVVPTREIAIQIRDVIRNLSQCMRNLSCEAFIGGLSVQEDHRKITQCQIMVGTPGRLMALMNTDKLNAKDIKLIVMDEADKLMADIFKPQIQYIYQRLPTTKQCIAFSATFTDELLESLNGFMKSPQIVRLTTLVPTLEEVQQYYENVQVDENKMEMPLEIYKAKFEAVGQLLSKVPFYQCMIFLNSVPRAMELTKWLTDMGWQSGYIHAGLTQIQRIKVMEQMRDFKLRVLVCSDLIARGIDIDRVNLVINVDFPWEIETYLHRVGRTGRFGMSGIAVNLIGPSDHDFLQALLDHGVTVNPLPDNVSYSEFQKELNDEEQKLLSTHQERRNKDKSKPIQFPRTAVKTPKGTKTKPSSRLFGTLTSDTVIQKPKKRVASSSGENPVSKKSLPDKLSSSANEAYNESSEATETSYYWPYHDTTSYSHAPPPPPLSSYPAFPPVPFPPFPTLPPSNTTSTSTGRTYPLFFPFQTTSHFIPPDLHF